jgi:signal transduction histidine kinase
MKIARKLLLSFLLVVVLPMTILGVLTTHIIDRGMEEGLNEALEQDLKAAWIQYYVRGDQMKYGMLQAAAEETVQRAVSGGDYESLRTLMKAWKRNRPYVDLWVIFDGEGRVISRLNTEARGDFWDPHGIISASLSSKTPLISTEVLPGDILVREGVISEGGPLWEGMLLLVATPVVAEGEALGTILTGDLLNGDGFVPETLEEKIPGLKVSLLRGGKVISSNVDWERELAPTGGEFPFTTTETSIGEGVIIDLETASGPLKTALVPISNREGEAIGTLLIGLPKARFTVLKEQNMKAIAGVSLLGLLLAGGIAVLVIRGTIRPLSDLAQATRQVQRGDFDVRLEDARLKAEDEIGDLARSFQTMVDRVGESYEDLERLVEERTGELLFLQKVNNLLNSGARVEEVLHTIAEGLTTVFPYEICAIHLLDEEKSHLRCVSYSVDSHLLEEIERRTGVKAKNYRIPLYPGSMFTELIETKRPIHTTDIVSLIKSHTDRPDLQALAPLIARIAGFRSGIGVPLLSGEKIVGVIGIGSRRELEEADEDRLFNFSRQAGLAVERAQVFQWMEKEIEKRTRELKESKEFLDSVFNSITDIIYIRDRDYRVLKANEMASKPFGKAVIEELFKIYRNEGGDSPRGPEFSSREIYSERLDEHLLVNTYPIREGNGECKAVVETVRVVTERKKLERQLLQSEKLASLGRLAAGVAHEINNPLAVISLHTQLLLEKARGANRETLRTIKGQVDVAAGIVRSLLEFSHPAEGSFAEVDLDGVVQQGLVLLEHQILSAGILVEKDLKPGVHKVRGDRNQLQQVMVNVLTNAIQAMPHGGKLTVSSWEEDGRCGVRISDTGEGIPEEQAERIFDPFFTTKEVGEGTGLGLFIAYGIVQRHRGKILVESRMGEGTTFTIQLPKGTVP